MNNDLISRSRLRMNFIQAVEDENPELYGEIILDLIDNAPTVEPEKVLIANVTFDEDKLKEIVQTEVIDKIKSGELVLKDERPQDEWVRKEDIIHLLECWADGYSYIEIPTDTAIKVIKEFKGDAK